MFYRDLIMKKIIGIFLIIAAIGGLIAWLIDDENPYESTPREQVSIKIERDRPKPKPLSKPRPKPVEKPKVSKSDFDQEAKGDIKPLAKDKMPLPSTGGMQPAKRPLSDEELEDIETYLDQVESTWNEGMREMIIRDFGLSDEDYQAYLELRDEYEEAKLESYEKWHEDMLAKHGPDYQFRATESNESFRSEATVQYLERLRERWGDDNYRRYIEYLDSFNESLRQERGPEQGLILIDL